MDLWHERLGHMRARKDCKFRVQRLLLPHLRSTILSHCGHYLIGKQQKVVFC